MDNRLEKFLYNVMYNFEANKITDRNVIVHTESVFHHRLAYSNHFHAQSQKSLQNLVL